MSSIGELFIQLGVLGNANELKKANQEFQKANALTEKQNKLDKLRAETLERIQKAETKAEKRRIVEQYRAKKLNVEKQSALKMQLLEKKNIKGNIAQWATYAHMVSMASSIAVSAIKKINSEFERLLKTNQEYYNIYQGSSSSFSTLKGYSAVASFANPNLSQQQVASTLARLNQKFFVGRKKGDYSSFVDAELSNILGGDSSRLFNRVYSGEFKTFDKYLEAIRGTISGKSPEMQSSIAQAFLGGDDSLLPMLRLTPEEFKKLQQQATKNALSESELKKLADLNTEISAIKDNFNNLYQKLLIEMLPTFEQIWREIGDVFKNVSSQDVKDAFHLIAVASGDVLKLIAMSLKGWTLLLAWLDEKIGNKKAQEQIDKDAYAVYSQKEGKYVPNVAGGSWANQLQIDTMNTGLKVFRALAEKGLVPSTALPSDALRNINNSRNSSVTFTGDIHVSTPQTGSQFANDFMSNLTDQRNFSY